MALGDFVLVWQENVGLFICLFVFLSVDFKHCIRNTSERIKNCVECDFDVKIFFFDDFFFFPIATVYFGFEVMSNSKFIPYSIF